MDCIGTKGTGKGEEGVGVRIATEKKGNSMFGGKAEMLKKKFKRNGYKILILFTFLICGR